MGEVFAIRQLGISSRATIATAALLAPILLFMGTCFILPLVELLRLSFTGGHGPLWAYREIAESEVRSPDCGGFRDAPFLPRRVRPARDTFEHRSAREGGRVRQHEPGHPS